MSSSSSSRARRRLSETVSFLPKLGPVTFRVRFHSSTEGCVQRPSPRLRRWHSSSPRTASSRHSSTGPRRSHARCSPHWLPDCEGSPTTITPSRAPLVRTRRRSRRCRCSSSCPLRRFAARDWCLICTLQTDVTTDGVPSGWYSDPDLRPSGSRDSSGHRSHRTSHNAAIEARPERPSSGTNSNALLRSFNRQSPTSTTCGTTRRQGNDV